MERLDKTIEDIRVFTKERDWEQFHTPENLAKSISIEAAELLECFQWDSNFDPDELKDEIADVMTYCLMLTDALNLDPIELIDAKMKKNIAKYPVEKSRGNITKYNRL